MPDQDNSVSDSLQNARVVFQQYWLHARHVENHRLLLTNLFVIVFAALLGCMAFIEQTSSYIPLVGFVLSCIGLFTIHSARVPLLRFSRMAEMIMDFELGLGQYRRLFHREGDGLTETKDKFWNLHRTFVVFYCLAGGGWVGLFAHSYLSSWGILLALSAGVTAGLYGIYRFTFWNRELKIEEDLRKMSDGLNAHRGHVGSDS